MCTVVYFIGADSVRFKAEINFDGREVARLHTNRLDLEKLLKVNLLIYNYNLTWLVILHVHVCYDLNNAEPHPSRLGITTILQCAIYIKTFDDYGNGIVNDILLY